MDTDSKLTYTVLNRKIPATPGKSILELSIQHKIPHLHECGGHGICTTCRIRVLDGMSQITPKTSAEEKVALERTWDQSTRLACQARLLGGSVAIERMIWTSAETSHFQLEKVSTGIGEERDMAFLFCDMRNFTPIAEKQLNFDLAHILNRFFTALGDPVYMNNGIIYQYAGDEIIAIFGAGGDRPQKSCTDAIRAALGMLYAIRRLNKWDLQAFDVTMSIGIGIHFGRAFIGNVGHHRHKQFAIIGDPMNVTSRIQSKNKELKTELLISEVVHHYVDPGLLHIGAKSKVQLKGKSEVHTIYEVKSFASPDYQLSLQSSIHHILRDEAAFAQEFYEELFSLAPEVRDLFSDRLSAQGTMITSMLQSITYTLSRPDHLRMGLKELGKQHHGYGVQPAHYPVVKKALLTTIENRLGHEYTEEMESAWNKAIDTISDIMLDH